VGGPAVMEALQRSDSTTAVSRLGRTLHHYLVRMSSRPTPYGLFACRTRRPGQAHRCTNRGDESRHTNPPGYEMTVGTDIRIGQRRAHAGTRHTWPTPNSLSGPADGSILRESPATSTQTAARPFQCATTLVRLAVQLARNTIRHADLVAKLRAESTAPPTRSKGSTGNCGLARSF